MHDDTTTLPRRTFLQVIGFSAAALALESCRGPEEKIVPYLTQPTEMTPGLATWYASTCRGCSAACGTLIKVREGRPIKLEGNPDHPLSRGGLCAVAHAMVFDLFDAERLRAPMIAGVESDWKLVDSQIMSKLKTLPASGKKVRVLTGSSVGPTMQRAIDGFNAGFPDARHITYDAVSYSGIREAHARSHGIEVVPHYRFDRALVIASFDADFLGSWISPVEFTRAYSGQRDVSKLGDKIVRHIQIESRMSLTGANADRRIVASPGELAAMLAALAIDVSNRAGMAGVAAPPQSPALSKEHARDVARLAAELWMHRGTSLVVSGLNDAGAQYLVNVINEALGNYGSTVDIAAPSLQIRGNDRELDILIGEMEAGQVGALVVYGVNPSYDLLATDRFNRGLTKVDLTISLNPRSDETSSRMRFVCPTHHFLESWDDAEPVAGMYSLVQPAIAPLFNTRSATGSLLQWAGDNRTSYAALRATWSELVFPKQTQVTVFDDFWEKSLRDGVISAAQISTTAPPAFVRESLASDDGVAIQRGDASVKDDSTAKDDANVKDDSTAKDDAVQTSNANAASLSVVLYEKPGMRDGSHAGSPWIQEFPDPISRISWGNYACVAPQLARERGLVEGSVVGITAGNRRIELPVHIQKGQDVSTIAIALGYGRTNAGATGSNVGANAFSFVGALPARRNVVDNVTIESMATVVTLATVQPHDSSEGRDLVRRLTLDEYLDPKAAEAGAHDESESEAMWPGHEYREHKWGMAIDLNACTGCGACVVSCQAENNIPVVGREEIINQREMYWLRIDRYVDASDDDPTVAFQPMLCIQCANAPCENVCPVLATIHSDEGLNMQVYNRCVGTRYCANNCPTKVRRFNWFGYPHDDLLANLALNPDVTVRSRGVMEKCTFCIQRIQSGKIDSRNDGRAIADGEVVTACQQSCPAQAITFGDLVDHASDVSKKKLDRRNYVVLKELNLQSSLSYMSSVRNTREA